MIEKEQELLARVLDLFAQRFDRKAVLRWGNGPTRIGIATTHQ